VLRETLHRLDEGRDEIEAFAQVHVDAAEGIADPVALVDEPVEDHHHRDNGNGGEDEEKEREAGHAGRMPDMARPGDYKSPLALQARDRFSG
jgi:hypothetical protein